nr:retrovirus-related Pol polyprotein from transposon TNT 1-94 [Tanacetum cinerariifolium]
MNNDKVIAPGIFRINPFMTSREENHVPNTVRVSNRTKSITVSQPLVFTKKNVNYNSNGLSSTGLDNRNLKLLINFDWKFMGTVRFGNDHVATILGCPNYSMVFGLWMLQAYDRRSLLANQLHTEILGTVKFGNDHMAKIMGYDDYKIGNVTISSVYFVEGLGHNLFSRLHLLHMDLCGPMRIASINGLCFGDCRRLLSLHVVERQNQTLVEAARTMLIFSRAPLFLWAEAIATACFTQNRSIIHRRFNKTPYELINGRKLDISFLHVFGTLCYPKNDREDIGKLGAKGDIGFFIGYSTDSCAYIIYNQRTKKIMETMNVSFDGLSAMAFEQRILKPGLQSMTSGQISSGLDLTYAPSTITKQQPTEVSTMEPKNAKEAMTDPAWIDSMQEELLQFKRLDVWVLVPAPNNISSLTLKWLFKNKHDEEQTVIRNKPRLVVRGYRQEEGIDFKESFALASRAWYDELSTFLLHNHFIKGTINPTLFIRRFHDDILVPLRNVDDGGNDVFLSLQVNQSPCGIFINQSKYVLEILNKYGMESCDHTGTPMEIKDKLDLDQNGTPIDATK